MARCTCTMVSGMLLRALRSATPVATTDATNREPFLSEETAILTASGYANITATNGTLIGIASLRQVFNATWKNSEQDWLVEDDLPLWQRPSPEKPHECPDQRVHDLLIREMLRIEPKSKLLNRAR